MDQGSCHGGVLWQTFTIFSPSTVPFLGDRIYPMKILKIHSALKSFYVILRGPEHLSALFYVGIAASTAARNTSIGDQNQKLHHMWLETSSVSMITKYCRLVLWDVTFVERLWCIFELAGFLKSHAQLSSRVVIRPVLFGPCALAIFGFTCMALWHPLIGEVTHVRQRLYIYIYNFNTFAVRIVDGLTRELMDDSFGRWGTFGVFH